MNNQDIKDKEFLTKEIIEENKILFEQLRLIQEEIEIFYCKKSDNNYNNSFFDFFTNNIEEFLIENYKLQSIITQQQSALKVTQINSLAARLGEILIKGVSSIGKFSALPVKLLKQWWLLRRTIPLALGDQHFSSVLKAYTSGGADAVEKLLNSVPLSSVMRANAYTALARQLMAIDSKQAANFARVAWETDPCAYRYKWLAFRIFEADDPITAEAIFNILPKSISLKESEQHKLTQIRYASKERLRELAHNKVVDIYNKLKKTIDDNIKQHNIYVTKQIIKERAEFQQEITNLKNKIIDFEKNTEDLNKEIITLRKVHTDLQHKMEIQKKEFDTLTIRSASIIKDILTLFENNQTILPQIMHIITRTYPLRR